MPATNKYLEAFKEGYNALGLAGCVALSAALLNPLPLVAGLVAETLYLLFVPDSKWYDARLSARYDNEVIARREKLKAQLFPSLNDDMKSRFARLEVVRNQINGEMFEGKHWFREVLRKLDYLLEKFLLFATKEVQFRAYLQSVLEEVDKSAVVPPPRVFPTRRGTKADDDRSSAANPDRDPDDNWARVTSQKIQDNYKQEIAGIDALMQQDENLHNQAVLDKHKEVLGRRQQYVAQIADILTNLNHQLSLMEDTFGLINDEIRARSPEQVLADIEDVVFQTDTLTETLQAVSPFDQMPVAPGSAKLYDVPEEKQG